MSDVKRTLKVIGIIGALECLFLQEVSEAREGAAHDIFARQTNVLMEGRRQEPYASFTERDLASAEPSVHQSAPSYQDSFPTRPIASEPKASADINASQSAVRDSFPRAGEKGELSGKVTKEKGNLMASRGEATSGKTQVLADTKIYIFKGKVDSGLASGEMKLPSTTDSRIVDVVTTDAGGTYHAKLPAGTYTLFLEKDGKLYSNLFDRTGHFSSIEVKTGERAEENLKDTSEALY